VRSSYNPLLHLRPRVEEILMDCLVEVTCECCGSVWFVLEQELYPYEEEDCALADLG
jgi:hypothetical protein